MTCRPEVKGLNGKDVSASCLVVAPEIVVGDIKNILVSITVLPVQLDKHLGVRAGTVDAACLDRNVVADIWGGVK